MMDSSISRFWDQYISKTRNYNLRKGASRWYVKHTEACINFHSGLKLIQHQPEHIESFFTYKSKQPRIKNWQFQQVVQAFEVLFSDLIKPQWAAKPDTHLNKYHNNS